MAESKNSCWPCSNCCKGTLVKASVDDLLRWRAEQNYDIILCLEESPLGAVFLSHKENGECVFLSGNNCTIYETRPEVCRLFPRSRRQAEDFKCKLKCFSK